MPKNKRWVVWPSYFDAGLKRNQGRRVNRKDAVESPTVQMISDALKAIGVEHEIDGDAGFPSQWFRKEGRVFVDNKMSKRELLKAICDKMKK